MSRIPPEHEAARSLEESFRHLGEERARERRRTRRASPVGRALLGAVALVTVAAAAATGSRVFLADGGSIPPAPGGLPARLKESPAYRHLSQAKARDPKEPVPWGVRRYTSSSGDTCLLLGRVVGARLGLVQGGRFTELPAKTAGVCNDLDDLHVLVTIRNYGDIAIAGGRSVLYGVADRTVSTLALRMLPAVRRPIPIAADGTFVVVLEGPNKLRNAQLIIDGVGGTTERALGG